MDEAFMERLDAFNDKYVTEEDSPEAPPLTDKVVQKSVQIAPPWIPIDLYRHNQRKLMANAKKEFPKGSSALVMAATDRLLNGREGLAFAKKRAEDDSESLKAQGYKDRAALMVQQYMEEKFLPVVETIVNSTSPDEVLNSKEALEALDEMALGVGSMRGYTAAYIRQAYGDQLGQKRGGSDPVVSSELERIKSLIGNDQIRTAIGLATKLKEQVDNGEHMAGPEDYAVIGRIVAYAN